MLAHAFRYVQSVVFLVGPDNIRSQRAVEKIGGVRFGSRPDGDGQDSIAYRIESSGRPGPTRSNEPPQNRSRSADERR
jgi:RimJ/RimL family protein N-acetyltransferase